MVLVAVLWCSWPIGGPAFIAQNRRRQRRAAGGGPAELKAGSYGRLALISDSPCSSAADDPVDHVGNCSYFWAYFKNFVLVACFLGSVGLNALSRRIHVT